MKIEHPRPNRPRRLHSMLEPRAALELAVLPGALPWLQRAPRGDGHPVLLVPGFLSREFPLAAMQAYLGGRGYAVDTWGFGRNVGLQRRLLEAVEQKVRHLHHRHRRRVSIVGWSLGGTFALYCAHHLPECVRGIVTLGSPVNVGVEGSGAAPIANALYRLVAHPLGSTAHAAQPRLRGLAAPASVPMSCLYSVSDGVVPVEQATLPGDAGLHENIRVPGSHCGLGFNAFVLWIVANRLAQAEGRWRPFEPSGLAGAVYRAMTHPRVPV